MAGLTPAMHPTNESNAGAISGIAKGPWFA